MIYTTPFRNSTKSPKYLLKLLNFSYNLKQNSWNIKLHKKRYKLQLQTACLLTELLYMANHPPPISVWHAEFCKQQSHV